MRQTAVLLVIMLSAAIVALVLPGSEVRAGSGPVDAQSSTSHLLLSSPSDCTVDERPPGDFVDAVNTPGGALAQLLGTPVATPAPPVGSTPAPDDVVAAVTATMEELAGCINAGDFLRSTALFTNDYFTWLYGGVSESALQGLATPTPLPPEEQIESVAVEAVTLLTDGRVSADVQLDDTRSLVVFVQAGDRYLIDYVYPQAPSATPVP